MRANGLHDIDVPEDIETHRELQDWWHTFLDQFSPEAHQAWSDRTKELFSQRWRTAEGRWENPPEFRQLIFNKLGFLEEFDRTLPADGS